MNRIGTLTTDWLNSLRRRVEAGELGLTAAEAQARDAAAQQERAQERRHLQAIERARLPQRHRQDAARILAGELQPSEIWRRLRTTLRTSPGASVILCGGEGSGKTTAATGWALERILDGWSVGYCALGRFERVVRRHDLREQLEGCDLLLVDEIHRMAGLPDWLQTPVTGLVDYRYHEQRQTLAMGTIPLKTRDGTPDLTGVLGIEVVKRFSCAIGTQEGSYR